MDETQVSTPVETTVEDTSTSVEPTDVDTSTVEPENVDESAETDVQEPTQEKLYAGKYKSIEEFEKGYAESQKFVTKAAELEKQLKEINEKQAKAEEQARQKNLEQAQQRGFDSVEAAQIADRVTLAEFEYYANGLHNVNPDYQELAQKCLASYYQTGDKEYLKQAKNLFPSEFVERAATLKNTFKNKLESEFQAKAKQAKEEQETRAKQEKDARDAKLAETIRGEFTDFLSDIETNEGKAKALKMFCDADFITSTDDMKVFIDVYDKIAAYAVEKAAKEAEASQAIENTKAGASIDSGVKNIPTSTAPSYNDIAKMTQKQFDEACQKYGLEAIIKAK